MEHYKKVVPPEQMMEPLLALLNETDCVPLVISGSSMSPFLAHSRDTVYLSRADRPLKRGDMILYQRDSGGYVLHRILSVEKDSFTLLGDAQTLPEPGIRPEQVRAYVKAVCRKGKLLQKGSFWWEFFEKVWIRMVPVRPVIIKIYAGIRRATGLR
ncbi:MAG: S24/S26 family peptidase [Firmicutes bacterium]|nr:S24/S26 family peptidase [Bacillota bacterium]